MLTKVIEQPAVSIISDFYLEAFGTPLIIPCLSTEGEQTLQKHNTASNQCYVLKVFAQNCSDL